MTKEIKYYKEKEYPLKWIPAEEMEETPQQTITRLEQENRELKDLNKKICEDWEKEIKVYWNVLEEIKNDLKEVCKEECDYTKPKFCGDCDCRYGQILNKINEALQ